jgi:hypothetical protein
MSAARRPRGTGSLTVHADSTGRRMWKARVHIGGGAYKKLTLGPVRAPGSRVGLTRTEAEGTYAATSRRSPWRLWSPRP